MNNASDYNLDAYANEIAIDIFADHCLDRDEAFATAWQPVDGSQWVIYHHKAHELCAACNTDRGEESIEDMGGFPDGSTYDSMASLIAYSEIMARVNEALTTLFDIAEANDEAAVSLVNDFVADQLEYEEKNLDAGDNYAHLPSESWTDQKTRDLVQALNEEIRDHAVEDHFAPASHKPTWEVHGVDPRWKQLDHDNLSDLALDAFLMCAGHTFGPYEGGIVLDGYPIGEVEIDLQHLLIEENTLTRISESCDCHIQGNLAYQSTDAAWFAVLHVEAFNALIADHFEA